MVERAFQHPARGCGLARRAMLNFMEDDETRGERREAKRRKRGRMRVVGRSVRLLQDIIRRKAERARKKKG